MPDRGLLRVGDRIRLTCVPTADVTQRERELRKGMDMPGWTANTIERTISIDPVVTICRIDEYGTPWFDVELVDDDGTVDCHSLNIMDNESWVLENEQR